MIVTVTHVTYVTRFPDERPNIRARVMRPDLENASNASCVTPAGLRDGYPSRAGAIA